jgi:hypothetical protein
MRVVNEHGLFAKGLGRGMSITCCRDGIYTAGLLGITPATQVWCDWGSAWQQLAFPLEPPPLRAPG